MNIENKINEFVDSVFANKNHERALSKLTQKFKNNLEQARLITPSIGFEVKIDEIDIDDKKYDVLWFSDEDLLLWPKKGETNVYLVEVEDVMTDKEITKNILNGVKKLYEVAGIGDQFENVLENVLEKVI